VKILTLFPTNGFLTGRGLSFVLERAARLAAIQVCAAAPGSRLGH